MAKVSNNVVSRFVSNPCESKAQTSDCTKRCGCDGLNSNLTHLLKESWLKGKGPSFTDWVN